MTGQGGGFSGQVRAVRLSGRTGIVLAIGSLGGLVAFAWPLLLTGPPPEQVPNAAFTLLLIVPVLVAVMVAEATDPGARTGGLDAKTVAMLGVLSAVNAALRPLGAGTAGIELMFFMLVLAGRVFGPGFGFVLGSTSMFASALLTAGVGPWLPYQMLAASWVGLGAGLLPRRARGRTEIAMLAGYAVLSSYLYGALMNLSFWPFSLGLETQLSFVAGAPVVENLHRFVVFTALTSALGWDTARALTNALAVVLLGPAVLVTLRRAARRAAFDAPVSFTDATPQR